VKFSFNVRIAFAAILAFVMLTMQCFGLMHRIAHGHEGSTTSPEQSELWLVIANGGEVSAAAWLDAQSHANNANGDPWHAHHSAADCERFDALCAASALLAYADTLRLPAPSAFELSRVQLAVIAARAPRALARAPPLA
jgi:hypothetical protein